MKKPNILIPLAVSAALGFLQPATAAEEHDPAAEGHDPAAEEHDHAAEGHDHAAEEHDHAAEEHDHAAEEHDHAAEEHDHAAEEHDHAAEEHDPAAEGHDHADHADADDHAEHEHDETIVGPNGGRVFTDVEPHLEFFVTDDRKVRITPVDEEGKAIAPDGQVVRLVGVNRLDPTRMSFEKAGGSLISDKAFPAGNNFPVVVLIQATTDAPVTYEKFNLNLSECPECGHAEYACTCAHDEHDHGDHEGHDH